MYLACFCCQEDGLQLTSHREAKTKGAARDAHVNFFLLITSYETYFWNRIRICAADIRNTGWLAKTTREWNQCLSNTTFQAVSCSRDCSNAFLKSRPFVPSDPLMGAQTLAVKPAAHASVTAAACVPGHCGVLFLAITHKALCVCLACSWQQRYHGFRGLMLRGTKCTFYLAVARELLCTICMYSCLCLVRSRRARMLM